MTKTRWELTQEIKSKIDEFFTEICKEYGIVIYNDLDWDFK